MEWVIIVEEPDEELDFYCAGVYGPFTKEEADARVKELRQDPRHNWPLGHVYCMGVQPQEWLR